ncbi:major facilitator superfamily domain-containing protein [Aspergillus cavernicola]|uniref:Major facilitator superfamily domain-containing protein n=1 Tax=Aspergillus cavernicola TaxID=176166 RepID=A0ABR4IP01_9EURO
MQLPRTPEDPEREPLLGERSSPAARDASPNPLSRHHRRLLLLVCATIVAADFGSALALAPQISIFESLICRRIGDGVDCKSPEVQGELALLTGWKETADQLPGIILALPYGFAADRIGRKPILLLAVAGVVLEDVAIRLVCWWNAALPLRMIWATPVFQIIGGGSQTATAMVYAMITDMVPAEKRASVFYIIAAAILLGEILATPTSAFLMAWSAWLPSLLSILFELLGLFSAAFIPETRPEATQAIKGNQDEEEREDSPISEDNADHGQNYPSKPTYHRWKDTVKRYWMHIQGTSVKSWNFNMVYIVCTFLLASIGRQALQLVIPYASKRFSWSIPRASFLVTLKGIINLVTLLFILPPLSTWLSKHASMSPALKDLRIVQGSAWLLTLGTILMSLAAQPPLFTFGLCFLALGWGFYSALRSLATALVLSSQVGVLSSCIGLAQSTGSLIAGPILAAAFRHALRMDGLGMGLPYMMTGGLFFLASCLTCLVRISGARSRP